MNTSTRPQSELRRSILLTALAILLIAAPGCKTLGSKAKGQASNLVCEADVGLIDGEPDAGVTVGVTVKNVGGEGFINVEPELSTSEGEWKRSQDLHFDAGESKTLTYFFQEPTINAGNIQCRVGVYPNAK